ncbi:MULTISPECIES: PepSY-associated TM helix domain-containing protein [unclassified Sphingopyxis]|uniref:PepSY-associated TM helix domain-containing protein n=1 Tax=unclassified Sphingopyxis TaxID=2614943 RepID=UPI00285D649B|nr:MULTISPECIES: PepSY-associated TM helix domain-containing protein [unclassified Sphingopyxis]MDR7060148.1 putative iron-regulated membrane protein [Sphingopyxis sp. BE235]MDR7180339.1 putative iron-regulated membrane protein [Sphingopyxis sp. BE249]
MSKVASNEAPGVRQSMAWIHGWLGLLAGWILFAMFLTGTASYFRPEITRWMQPEIDLHPVAPATAADTAVAHLQKVAPTAEQWFITLPDARTTATRIFIRERPNPDPNAKPAPRRPELRLDPATGEEVTARDTRGGEHFYRFHFQLQIPHPWGRWLAGLCAMAMLAAIISGVITHKRIFVDFFTLRWSKGQRSWLDAHNVSAVIALPFHAMITYTGLITLVAMYMPWPIEANYKDPATFETAIFGAEPDAEASGRFSALTPVAPLVAKASEEWGGGRPATMVVRNPNDETATVTLFQSAKDRLNARGGSIVFSGVDGRRLSASPPPGPAAETSGVMLGLHMGSFAGPVLRWTYFLLGLAGTAMVGTGLMLWTVKRKRPGAAPFFGIRLAERLNVGAIACLPAGMAAFLLANRLLPATLPARGDVEVSIMFWTWFGLAALACVRPIRRAWTETLAIAAVAFVALPLVNALTTDRGFVRSLANGDWLFVAFDLAMIATGALLGFGAWRAAQISSHPVRKPHMAPRPASALREAVDAR